jgi:hypothetical protein
VFTCAIVQGIQGPAVHGAVPLSPGKHATTSGGAARRGHFYPGTGAAGEVGVGAGEGFTVNVPWPCGGMGNGARAYWRHWQAQQYPAVASFSVPWRASDGAQAGAQPQ